MGLSLAGRIAGDTVAQAIQLGIEYDPQPPYDSGSPRKAPAEVVELLRGLSRHRAEPDQALAGSRYGTPLRAPRHRPPRVPTARQAGDNVRSPMPEHRYDPHAIERRWQELWARERTWEVSNRDPSQGRGSRSRTGAVTGAPGPDEPDTYVLEMLPYPSGEPHIGHLKCYSLGDAIAHYCRRRGARVLHPMGYDAFGLPAENHAIRTGVHPRVSTAESIASFQEQFRSWGISIDWSRELATSEPSYYRWTQWIFLELFRAGLAYRSEAAVKWCPNDQTVLANEQVTPRGTASAAGPWWRSASSSSGCCGSPTTPSGC